MALASCGCSPPGSKPTPFVGICAHGFGQPCPPFCALVRKYEIRSRKRIRYWWESPLVNCGEHAVSNRLREVPTTHQPAWDSARADRAGAVLGRLSWMIRYRFGTRKFTGQPEWHLQRNRLPNHVLRLFLDCVRRTVSARCHPCLEPVVSKPQRPGFPAESAPETASPTPQHATPRLEATSCHWLWSHVSQPARRRA